MRVLNQSKISKNIKKSQILFIGSLLVFIGLLCLSSNYLLKIRSEVFSDMKISMMDVVDNDEVVEEINNDFSIGVNEQKSETNNYTIDYSKYLGVLEIPKIGLKRGFYNIDSKYNNIQYNVTMVNGSSLPDTQGNLILMAHSGDSYISYFAYLYRLSVGDQCFVTYNGIDYHYQIVNIYDVPKNGIVTIRRDPSKKTLTMITCTKDSDTLQTVYIAEYIG